MKQSARCVQLSKAGKQIGGMGATIDGRETERKKEGNKYVRMKESKKERLNNTCIPKSKKASDIRQKARSSKSKNAIKRIARILAIDKSRKQHRNDRNACKKGAKKASRLTLESNKVSMQQIKLAYCKCACK